MTQNFIHEFNGMIFSGFKFKKSNNYSDKYFEQLLEEGSDTSKVKYQMGLKTQLEELVWMDLSYAYLTKVIYLISICLSIVSIFALKNFSMTMLGIAIVGFFANKYFNRDANFSFGMIEETDNMTEFIFANK